MGRANRAPLCLALERMDKEPEIRKARLCDVSAIQNCVEAAYQHYINRIGKPPGPMLDDYAEVIEHHKVFVAETENIVGVLVLIQKSIGVLLDNIAVHPEQQGKGLGKRLINLAETETRASGFKKLDLYTHECMGENIELYKSLGYTETERKEEQGYNRVYMQKCLVCKKRDDAL